MVQISGENSKPFWSMLSGRMTEMPPLSPPLSKDEGLRDIGHIMSIGNLILGVNSVTVSYLIHYDSLLQNSTEVYCKMRQDFYYKMRQFFLQNATIITNYNNFITKCDSYYKVRRLLQIATVHLTKA